MENNILKLNIKKYIYFLLVFVISMTVLIVAPMWQNDLSGFHLKLPNSKSGWLAYIVLRTVVSLLNMLIFACFVHQGELNCAENPNKLEDINEDDSLNSSLSSIVEEENVEKKLEDDKDLNSIQSEKNDVE